MASPKRLNFDVSFFRTLESRKNDQNIDVYFKRTRLVYCITSSHRQSRAGDQFVYVLRCIKTLQKTSQNVKLTYVSRFGSYKWQGIRNIAAEYFRTISRRLEQFTGHCLRSTTFVKLVDVEGRRGTPSKRCQNNSISIKFNNIILYGVRCIIFAIIILHG